MTETIEQSARLADMPDLERLWRTTRGISNLRGYQRWKAGAIVLHAFVFLFAFTVLQSYFLSLLIFFPVSLIFSIDEFTSISTNFGLVFHFFAFLIFIVVGPTKAISTYHGLRYELETLTRETGSFWQHDFCWRAH